MVSKRNYPQNVNRNQMQHQIFRRRNHKFGTMYIKDYNRIFDANQMPDNPGYVDFNLPAPNLPAVRKHENIKNLNFTKPRRTNQLIPNNNKKHSNAVWNRSNNSIADDKNRFALNIRPSASLIREREMRRIQMFPPVIEPRLGGISTYLPHPPPHVFQPPNLLPAHRAGPSKQLISTRPPMFARRNLPPVMPSNILPPIPPVNHISNISKVNKTQTSKQMLKGKSIIKTLKTLMNQYPMDKPWVTAEIRTEYNKKVDIENSLKGHKDDELFAKFKVQRDKFVAMYEAARYEYLKEEAAAVKARVK